MAKKKKALDVQKFGGTENLGTVKIDDGLSKNDYELSNVEAKSETRLEYDEGHGDPVIIRCFTFGINPQAWKEARPDKQQLFNHHLKGIEISLWKDGLKVFDGVQPRVVTDEKKMQYSIFVACRVARGHMLNAIPKTLTQIAHG